MLEFYEIAPPNKVSGTSSFVIAGTPTQVLPAPVFKLLNSDRAIYNHKKDGIYELSVISLINLLDQLTFIDDIKIHFIDKLTEAETDLATKPLSEEEISAFKIRPFDHQLEAINYGLAKKQWLLLDSMGVGKTNTMIWLAETLKRRGLIDHCLIICGVNALKQNWKHEIEKFSTETCRILGETKTKTGKIHYAPVATRAKELLDPIDAFFVIVNIEAIRDERVIQAFNKSANKFGMIALDEAHRCLTGNTVISTTTGDITIKDLYKKTNEELPKVLSYNLETGQNEYQSIENIVKSDPYEDLLELIFEDNNIKYKLQCTASHKIYTANRGWVKAKDLKPEDDIKLCVTEAKLVSKRVINTEPVYDLTVSKNHNFYGNHILVHNCATKKSIQGHNLLALKAPYLTAATGTPITNNPVSCYVPLAWTHNEKATLTTYKAQYCVFDQGALNRIVGYKDLDQLKNEIDNCSIRRTIYDVVGEKGLQPKTVSYEIIEMNEDHRKFYDAIKNGVKEEANKVNLSNNLLALTTRLRQASSCPSFLTTQKVSSSKVDRCVELVEDLIAQNEKVVILSIFKETTEVLRKALEEYQPMIATGDTDETTLEEYKKRFQEDFESINAKIMIGTWEKLSTGLTLNAAKYLICMDTPYTYAMFSQGTDRIWRITNTHPAYIKVLVNKDTIDERVMEIVEKKKDLSDFLIDGAASPDGKRTLNDELRDIIGNL